MFLPASALVDSTNHGNVVSPIARPQAIFPPDIWVDFCLQYASQESEPMGVDDSTMQQVRMLKEEVKKLFRTSTSHSILQKLEFIDTVQCLGVSHHFEHEIDEALEEIHNRVSNNNNVIADGDLHFVALLFRLLRQQGYQISSDVFTEFKSEEGKFNETLSNDVQGLWGLYEAAQLRVHGEDILDETRDFTYTCLKSLVNQLSPSLSAQINRSLSIPFHKRGPRSKARYHMAVYEEDPSHDETILTFAKVDFNSLQKMHQKEIGSIAKWLKESDFKTKVPYARERLVEPYLWSFSMSYEPEYSIQRRITGKLISCLTLLDDTYDAYGTFDELELFTEAIQRWDIGIIESLPQCMKVTFETLVESCKEIELMTAKSGKSSFVMPRVKQAICATVQAYMLEAKWRHEGYIPTYDEYKVNGIFTATYPLQLTTFIGLGKFATKEVFDWIFSEPNIIKGVSVIGRVIDDIVSHKFEQQRVHVASAVECCMKQYGISQEEAYELIYKDIEDCWKDINEKFLKPNDIPKPVLDFVANLARISEDVYVNRKDRYTNGKLLKDYVLSLFVDPVYIEQHQLEKLFTYK